MRDYIIAGNWKMNKTAQEGVELINQIKDGIGNLKSNIRVMAAPSFVNLYPSIEAAKNSKIEIVAQNIYQETSGAFTGETSATMLTAIGVKTTIIGHSERRTLFNETDELLADKVNTALENGLEIIFCFGETLKDRKTENHYLEVGSQIKKSLFHLDASAFKNIILAYEPVWAIGTGETATPTQAQEMHQFIRRIIEKKYGTEVAEKVCILYGGSVKPDNAKEIFSQADVDGGLIGGASLKATDFLQIINAV